MKILIIGDIVGRLGREAVGKAIAQLKKEHDFDLIIANGENMAHGSGMTQRTYNQVRGAGVDFFTSGNHIYKNHDIFPLLEDGISPIIRPANYPPGNIGRGFQIVEVGDKKILIINLMGRVFMGRHLDCPFRKVDEILNEHELVKLDGILIDFHAETTSEKIAFRHYVDGRISALWGTHTHVPTADAQITSKQMAYITDLGMVGPINSVIGAKKESIIESFLKQTSFKLEPADGCCIFNAIMIELLGRNSCKMIESVRLKIN